MSTRRLCLSAAPLLLAATLLIGPAALAAGDAAGDAAVVKALPSAKHSLLEGVRMAAKSPAIAISAKFEDEGHGLSLSVYTAGRGGDVEAEANVLQELAGDPTQTEWKPTTETFADVQHVARASEQVTLMRTTKRSLADAIASVDSYLQHFHDATVFSIAPAVREGKGVFLVGVAVAGQAYHLVFDLQTVMGLEPWPKMPKRPRPTPLVGKVLSDPVVGRGQWIGSIPAPLAEAVRIRVVLVALNSYLCEGTDEAYAWPTMLRWFEELAPKGLDVRFVVGSAERLEDVQAYVATHKIPYPVLHDPTAANANAWDLRGIAYGLVLGGDGKVVWQGSIGPGDFGDAEGCEAAIREEIRKRTADGTLSLR